MLKHLTKRDRRNLIPPKHTQYKPSLNIIPLNTHNTQTEHQNHKEDTSFHCIRTYSFPLLEKKTWGVVVLWNPRTWTPFLLTHHNSGEISRSSVLENFDFKRIKRGMV